jgi:polyribonucleotide nucleotidyltransferase
MSAINNKKEFKINFGGLEVTLEAGRMAKQADGAVLVSAGGTQVLVTVCSALEIKDGQDFFPLTVDYTEKFYSAGKFLGGFIKREARPTTGEVLTSRLIDRPLRPLFPEGYLNDTFVQATVLSYHPSADPEVLAGLGASAALAISDIPFSGPMGFCKVGRIAGAFKLNPTHEEWLTSDIEMVVAGSPDAILMVEGEAKFVPEAEMLEAILFAHKHIQEFCKVVSDMVKSVGKTKRVFTPAAANTVLNDKIAQTFSNDARAALSVKVKGDRTRATAALTKKIAEAIKATPTTFGLTETASSSKEARAAVENLLYNMMRADILNEEKRIGGRKLNEVRQIETEISVLSVPHGSGLFTRGETQVLSTATVGSSVGDQKGDRISGSFVNKFYLHYNFPPFSVGEAKGVRGTGRRELGHGNLAERALKVALPGGDFPYTIRMVCEVLESNGSSSMGSVCSGSMALMDAGVPMLAPIAGIAMGLISDGKRYKILSDILGDEDHLGDMDFKVAGSDKGITAIQMDIKISGLTKEIIKDAFEQARVGRLHILGEMAKTIKSHRPEYKAGIPKMETLKIEVDKIGMLIGPGGKNIKALQERYTVTIEIAEDGTVRVAGTDTDKLVECCALIKLQLNGPQIGEIFDAIVVSTKEYGAFVDIAPGVSGLLHISEVSNDRVNDVNEYLSEGDKIQVKVMEIDKMGRVKFSARAVKSIDKKVK